MMNFHFMAADRYHRLLRSDNRIDTKTYNAGRFFVRAATFIALEPQSSAHHKYREIKWALEGLHTLGLLEKN